MKYYDKNGNTHETMMAAAIADIKSRVPNVIGEPLKKEEPVKVDNVIPHLAVGKSIKIDRENNKLYLLDDGDNIIMESPIDPKLVARTTNDFIDIESVDPRLSDPKFIDTALNGDKVKNAIDKTKSIEVSN